MRLKQRSQRRKALRRLAGRLGAEISREKAHQMAGDNEEGKRLPKRPFHVEGEEYSGTCINGTAQRKSERKTCDIGSGKERRGKENSVVKTTVLTHCQANGTAEKMEDRGIQESDGRQDPSIFFDEDSNHIFPVGQFFGNLDLVQDYPRRTSITDPKTRREHRSLHFYAKEESDEEV
ncbi:UPF0688 protein C1orf174 homolog isoform X2 [Chanos chanos]|uniref:UPF0688 protein C1orf174 homolog isoform X2 n=1 Tax=Chanos chanos TaxID=29144 RepID=A0A6J2W5K0_CHACN|nr:UPF0688 protein C1orf174 homolog isoform X2 [Chanos chanos]